MLYKSKMQILSRHHFNHWTENCYNQWSIIQSELIWKINIAMNTWDKMFLSFSQGHIFPRNTLKCNITYLLRCVILVCSTVFKRLIMYFFIRNLKLMSDNKTCIKLKLKHNVKLGLDSEMPEERYIVLNMNKQTIKIELQSTIWWIYISPPFIPTIISL